MSLIPKIKTAYAIYKNPSKKHHRLKRRPQTTKPTLNKKMH